MMMTNAAAIFHVIAAVLVVMGVGFALRKLGVLTRAGTDDLGRLVADVTFPVLCFRGLSTTSLEVVRSQSAVPVFGFVTHGVAMGVGALVAAVACRGKAARPTCVFAIGMSNWIFVPLPLAKSLYGDAGVTVVLLHNVGAQLMLWTAGILVLKGGGWRSGASAVLRNPGLWATALGLLAAYLRSRLATSLHALGPIPAIGGAALDWVGGITIPVVTLAIGARLAEKQRTSLGPSPRADRRAVLGVVLGRLLIAPVVVVMGFAVTHRVFGFALDAPTRGTEYLIASMPVSLSVGALVERFGGDRGIAATSIGISTALSALTVPVLHAAAMALAT